MVSVGDDESERRRRFGAALRAYRVHAGLSQASLAVALDVSPNTVWRWERGLGVDIDTATRCERALALTDRVLVVLLDPAAAGGCTPETAIAADESLRDEHRWWLLTFLAAARAGAVPA